MAEYPPRQRNFTAVVHRLALFLLAVLLFEVFLIAIAPRLHSGSVLRIAKDSVLLRVRQDSWYYMAQGDQAWHAEPNAIYETTFFQRDIRFIYPPTSLLLYRACLGARVLHIRPFTAMKATLATALIATWAFAVEFFFALFSAAEIKIAPVWQRWVAGLSIAALILTFLPLINAFFLGQVQTLLNFLLIASAFLWLRGYRKTPGVVIGLTCWLKPTMALFLIWALLRRQWNFAVSLAAMLVAGFVVSLLIFGIHNTVEYFAVVRFLGQRGDALFTNQSLNGLLHRLLHIGSPVTWVYGYPPFSRTIYLATLISSLTLLIVALLVPVLRRATNATADFLLFAMAATMASPIAWEHHYGIFFLVFLLWIPTQAFRGWLGFLCLLGMYLLMTDNWAPLTPLMYTGWSFAISHVYFGGVLMFLWTLFHCESTALGRRIQNAG